MCTVMTLGDFSQQADAYRLSRPTYPPELLDLLVADAGVTARSCVADFGAGTGIMTRILRDRGFVVTAIEPNVSMQNRAELPDLQWITATFEASQLDSASQDWAIAAQAFHWADPLKTLPELRRVLRPGRLFTILWNNRASQDNKTLSWTEEAIRRHIPEFDEAYRNRAWDQILESTGDFTFLNHRAVRHTIPMSRERYLNLWNSHNRLNNIAGPDRFQSFYNELSDYLEQRHLNQIDVPYRCEAWSARRKD
jgi:SAM-dependent methyltransferase